MRKVTSTKDYLDLVDEHAYIYKFINEEQLVEPLLQYYELRMTEIENEIQQYNDQLSK